MSSVVLGRTTCKHPDLVCLEQFLNVFSYLQLPSSLMSNDAPPKPAKQEQRSAETASDGAICPAGHSCATFIHTLMVVAPGAVVKPKGQGMHSSRVPPVAKVPLQQKQNAESSHTGLMEEVLRHSVDE